MYFYTVRHLVVWCVYRMGMKELAGDSETKSRFGNGFPNLGK